MAKMRDGKKLRFSSRFILPLSVVFLMGIFIGVINLSEEDENRLPPIQAVPVFDGADTFGTTTVTATVVSSLPIIAIEKPENKTYENNESVELKIEITPTSTLLIDSAFYNLDDGENNTLVLDEDNKNETDFGVVEGSHTLKLFANNTANELNSTEINFFINRSIRFHVNHSKFDGDTVNFSAFNETDLQEIANLILEMNSFGKIWFLDVINLTDDNVTDGIIDLDSFIDFDNLTIFINESIFGNLEGKQAALYFYNVTFANPTVNRNGIACPSTICIATNLQGETFTVNVTNFSEYEVVAGGSGGGDNGGGGSGGSGLGGGGGSKETGTAVTVNLDEQKQSAVTVKKVARLYLIWRGNEYSAKTSVEPPSTVKLEFSKLGVSLLVPLGQSGTMDLDQDGRADVILEIMRIDQNTVTIKVTRLEPEKETIISEERRPTKEEPSQQFFLQTAKKALLNKDLIGITLLLIVAGIIVEMERRAKKKKRK